MADGPPDLTLPPPYQGIRLGEGQGAPFAVACAEAADLGAGALVWAERPDVLALAVVLEPETALATARCAFYAGMSALAEAVATCGAPERSVTLVWPDVLRYDAARLGTGRLAWPEGTASDAVPDWLVFSAELIRDRDELSEPGPVADTTSLRQEEIGPAAELIESFARHLMRNFDSWSALGFDAMAARYLERLAVSEDVTFGLAPNGDLLERTTANVTVRRGLAAGLGAKR